MFESTRSTQCLQTLTPKHMLPYQWNQLVAQVSYPKHQLPMPWRYTRACGSLSATRLCKLGLSDFRFLILFCRAFAWVGTGHGRGQDWAGDPFPRTITRFNVQGLSSRVSARQRDGLSRGWLLCNEFQRLCLVRTAGLGQGGSGATRKDMRRGWRV